MYTRLTNVHVHWTRNKYTEDTFPTKLYTLDLNNDPNLKVATAK